MDVILAAIVIGGLYPASLAAFIIQFARLRSDMHAGFDRLEARLDSGFDRLEACFDRLDSGFGGLETKVDNLIATPDRNERLTDLDGSGADD